MINNSEVLTTESPIKNCITQYILHSVLGRLPLPCYHDLIPSMPACWDYYKCDYLSGVCMAFTFMNYLL